MGCGGSKTQQPLERPEGKVAAKATAPVVTVDAVAPAAPVTSTKPVVKFYGDVNQSLTRKLLTAFHQVGVKKEEIEYH